VGSPQGIYLYLDGRHKVCNGRFAEMLEYASPADWDRPGPFKDQPVMEQRQHALVSTHIHAMQRQVAATVHVNWKSQSGEAVPASLILVPIAYAEELMPPHFLTSHEWRGRAGERANGR